MDLTSWGFSDRWSSTRSEPVADTSDPIRQRTNVAAVRAVPSAYTQPTATVAQPQEDATATAGGNLLRHLISASSVEGATSVATVAAPRPADSHPSQQVQQAPPPPEEMPNMDNGGLLQAYIDRVAQVDAMKDDITKRQAKYDTNSTWGTGESTEAQREDWQQVMVS